MLNKNQRGYISYKGIMIESEISYDIYNELTSIPFSQLSKHNHLMDPAGVYELQEPGFEHIWQTHIPCK